MKIWSQCTLFTTLALAFGLSACIDPQVKGIQGVSATAPIPQSTATPTATPSPTPTPTPAHTLSFSALSTTGTAGTALTVQPVIQVKNLSGGVITSGSFNITLTAYSDACVTPITSGFSITKNTLSTTNGVATFSGVTSTTLSLTHVGVTDGMVSACSSAISIGPGAADHLIKFLGDNITAGIGASSQTFTPIVVQVLDRYNNPYTAGYPLISINLFGSDSSAAFSVTSDAGGFASFSTKLGYSGIKDLWLIRGSTALPDLASTGNAQVTFTEKLNNLGNGSFSAAITTGGPAKDLLTGDFRGNNETDLILLDGAGKSFHIFTPNSPPDGNFNDGHMTFSLAGAPVSMVSGDFNHDGHLDIAVVDQTSQNVGVFLGNGIYNFDSRVDYGVGRSPTFIVAGDFNNDGFLDLAVTNGTDNTISILLNAGNGTFTAGATLTTANGPAVMAVGDLDQDGNLDLVVGNAANLVSIFHGNGDGTFKSKKDISTGISAQGLDLGDFNGDGILDLAVSCTASGKVYIHLGQTDYTYATPIQVNPGGAPTRVKVADINGDGKSDLIVTLRAADEIVLITGIGNGNFNVPSSLTPGGSGPVPITVGDYNRDGKLDIIIGNGASSVFDVFLGM